MARRLSTSRQQTLRDNGLDLAPQHAQRLFWARLNSTTGSRYRRQTPATASDWTERIVGDAGRLSSDKIALAFYIWETVLPDVWRGRCRLDAFTGGTFMVHFDGASSAYAFRRQLAAAVLQEIRQMAPKLQAKWIDCRVGRV